MKRSSMLSSLLPLVLLALVAKEASAEVKEIWYNITKATANPDGLFEREVYGLNGTWP